MSEVEISGLRCREPVGFVAIIRSAIMEDTAHRAIAIVGAGAILPEASNVAAFWENIKTGRYCISDVPPDRWNPAFYYDEDRSAPAKTYSKIGGWVREFPWEPMKWHLPIPPRVAQGMDDSQKWGLACAREALEDYGYPNRPLDSDRTAVILGTAMGGERHYLTALRVSFPEYEQELIASESFAALPETLKADITRELRNRIGKRLPEITEDSMPGELANCLAGRIANTYNFHGPNFTTDAACASAMAALSAAMNGLVQHDFDAVIAGGVDRNMGASTFVKFCKIGALSATGTRPFAEGADGFVMGEGAAIFVLKRLADAEGDGDKIYAVLRGIGGSSDGKGKGITAPNPIGQKFAIERAWKNAGLSPATVTLIEGHGTSTKVGDVVEVQSMANAMNGFDLPTGSVALGSVKSNIGHLKGAAGAAGLLKAALSLRDKVLPPSVNCAHTNPDIDFSRSPLYVNTELRPWKVPQDGVRRAGLSAFGFGGTNFHLVMEEYIPHRLNGNGKRSVAIGDIPMGVGNVPVPASAGAGMSNASTQAAVQASPQAETPVQSEAWIKNARKAPLRGALVIGADTTAGLAERLRGVQQAAGAGEAPKAAAPAEADLRAGERIAIDYGNAAELADRAGKALKALAANQPAVWKVLRSQGIFRGQGPAPKVAFLYTGQGSQYVNMIQELRAAEPIIAETFAEADKVLTPLIGKPLSEFIFIDGADPAAVAKAEDDLRQTAITQPAVIATDVAITRLLGAYGIKPDMAMGHSVGEYGALVATGGLPFEDSMEAVSARGREMTMVSLGDNGGMAAVFAPLEEIERTLKTIDGYVVIANINSKSQAVIGGESKALQAAIDAFLQAGYNAVQLPVSHAFHTSIVAGASEPLKRMLERLRLQPPKLPTVANVDGEFYPTSPDAKPKMVEMLARQVATPVQFVKGLQTLYDAGARVFVETGPKKALQGFAEDVLGDRGDVVSLFTNHPKLGDVVAFNQALCGLYAAGLGAGEDVVMSAKTEQADTSTPINIAEKAPETPAPANDREIEPEPVAAEKSSIVITGAALGLPGTARIFDDGNVGRILNGEQFIHPIPTKVRRAMLDKHITRLVKSDSGGAFETIDSLDDVIKLAGRAGSFDVEAEFGVSADRAAALDRVTALAMAAGIDALRDAGIPLVMRYKTTSKGTKLFDRWMLPESLRDDTGVIFASAFPGFDYFADEMARYYADYGRRKQLSLLQSLQARAAAVNGHSPLGQDINTLLEEAQAAVDENRYTFDRRFLFKALSMGHSQFAEFIGARGPNTQVNAACASTAQAISLAEDWIHAERCRRVIVVSADDVTSDHLLEWMGAGFLASGAAATDEAVEDAALPFDRRRHGMIVGMGAAALVVETADGVRERGIQPICEVLSTATANSAFHGTRLDVQHISQVMEGLVAKAEKSKGISRSEAAPKMVFISHETYTPARGGSASAEIHALRHVFGENADRVVIANTKGFTGHAMATGIEDVVAVKSLETGCVPPVANFKEIDPELGALNLSKGGSYPVKYALRLAAGFGSQISMMLLRWVPTKSGVHSEPDALGYAYRVADPEAWKKWLAKIAGGEAAELEVVHRTLRVRDAKVSARESEAIQDSQTAPVVLAAAAVETVAIATVVHSENESAPQVSVEDMETNRDPVKERILALVAAKTGYPVDMLDLDLDLEADLGVDTVKQAEVLATIREAYGIARDDSIKLRDYPTLSHVIRFVHERSPELGAQSPIPEATETNMSELKVAESAVETTNVGASDAVKEAILAMVVEKTGYPKEMLDLDLDLEADLGIDTVKQAELFVAVRTTFNIPRDENLKLRDYPTLARVIQFVYEKRPELAGERTTTAEKVEVTTPAEEASAAVAVISEEAIKEKVLQIVAEKTGYPKDMLDLDLDLEADLGVDTVKQAEMLAAVRAAYNIARDENIKLHDFPTLAHVIKFAYNRQPRVEAAVITETVAPKVEVVAPVAVQVATPAEVPAVAVISQEAIKEKVLEIVAEKTGYPKDMLDLDLDLEADLGVDTVKQAEMLAAVRTAYDIPRDESIKLHDFPTLAHVIKFAYERQPGVAAAQPQMRATTEVAKVKAAIPPQAAPIARPRPALASLDAANSIPRRVPIPILRPQLAICKPTGVKLGPGSRVVMMPDKSGVAEALTQQLQKIGVEVLRIEGAPDAETLVNLLKTWMAAGPVQGVYWLPALNEEAGFRVMDLAGWREALRIRVKLLYHTMRTLYEQIAAPGTFLVSATLLGGQHGYDEAGAIAPLGGAVVGMTKTYKRERGDVLVKAVDFELGRKASDMAQALLDETLRDPGTVEVGYKETERWTIGLREQPAADGQAGLTLDSNTVFVVTGAAGGIVSAITADLAAASGGTFYLLDMVPEPDPKNPDLKRFVDDKDGLKRDIFARIQASGVRATPALVEKELAGLERAQAALKAINAVHDGGGTAHYFSVNLTDSEAVARVMDQVRQRSGRIDVLLHAAGMERSHFLPDKEPREFDLVFDVKCDGWFNLLRGIGNMPLGATVCFSSIAGRFGNGGQADYSSANDLLCKITSSFRTTRPATRGIAIDWTAWGGIGMATRGSIPKMMEVAGIDMLPPEAGIPLIRRELTSGGTRGEIVIGQRLGILMHEWDATGGVDVEAVAKLLLQQGPMIGKVTCMGIHNGLTIETTLDPAMQAFLHDHQIGGTPVLPGVMGIEAFAEAALVMLPGWRVEAIEDVSFLAPFKFYRNQPRTLTIHAVISQEGDAVVADCQLMGSRTLPRQPEPEVTTHFKARVVMTKLAPAEVAPKQAATTGGGQIEAADIYRIYFHGPAYQVMHHAWRDGNRIVGQMATSLPTDHQPVDRPTVMAPRLIEFCFQTAGLWEISVDGRMGLPRHVERVCLLRSMENASGPLYAVVTPDPEQSVFAVEVVDAAGNLYLQMNGYKTIALPDSISTELLKALQVHA